MPATVEYPMDAHHLSHEVRCRFEGSVYYKVVVVLVGVPNRKDRRRSAVYPESQRRSGSLEEAWVYSGGRNEDEVF